MSPRRPTSRESSSASWLEQGRHDPAHQAAAARRADLARSAASAALRARLRQTPGLCVLTGGQTGVDTIAAAAALRAGLPVHLVFPAGFLQEDGPISDERRRELDGAVLHELASAEFSDRTWACVGLADAVVLVDPAGGAGCRETAVAATELNRPLLRLAEPSGVVSGPAADALGPAAGDRDAEAGVSDMEGGGRDIQGGGRGAMPGVRDIQGGGRGAMPGVRDIQSGGRSALAGSRSAAAERDVAALLERTGARVLMIAGCRGSLLASAGCRELAAAYIASAIFVAGQRNSG